MKPTFHFDPPINRPHGASEHHTADTNEQSKLSENSTNTQAASFSKEQYWDPTKFKTHWPWAVALARRRGVSDPESVATDSFFAACESFDPDRGSFRNWYYFLLRKRIYRVLKAELRFMALPESDSCGHVPSQLTVDPPEPALTDTIEKMLGELGPEDRDVLVAKFYYGESFEKIAVRLGLCSSSIRSRAFRALRFLRERFGIDNFVGPKTNVEATARTMPQSCRKKVPHVGLTPPLQFSTTRCNEEPGQGAYDE